jgi:type IV secretion system protein VirB1
MIDFITLAQQCAPTVEPVTMAAIVNVESAYNPYAIGVVDGRLERQPRNRAEAIATALSLEKQHMNFSVGMAQVNRYNLAKYNLSYNEAFEPCANLYVGSKILEDCYGRASKQFFGQQEALQAAFSCYYSGNFSRGFLPDKPGRVSYVQKIVASASFPNLAIPMVTNQAKTQTEVTTLPGRDVPNEDSPLVFGAVKPNAKDTSSSEKRKNREVPILVF